MLPMLNIELNLHFDSYSHTFVPKVLIDRPGDQRIGRPLFSVGQDELSQISTTLFVYTLLDS